MRLNLRNIFFEKALRKFTKINPSITFRIKSPSIFNMPWNLIPFIYFDKNNSLQILKIWLLYLGLIENFPSDNTLFLYNKKSLNFNLKISKYFSYLCSFIYYIFFYKRQRRINSKITLSINNCPLIKSF